MKSLSGKKTYMTAAGIIAVAVGSFLSGDANLQEMILMILNGLGLGTLRAGVAKAETKK